MAHRVEEFPEPVSQTRYPWEDWLDGNIWELTPGVDFKGHPATFRANAVTQANRREGRVRTRKSKGEDGLGRLFIQFYRD